MVIVQLFSFLRVSDNRSRRKIAREAAKLERERLRREKAEQAEDKRMHVVSPISGVGSYMDGAGDFPETTYLRCPANGHKNENGVVVIGEPGERRLSSSEESLTETSEEEMIL